MGGGLKLLHINVNSEHVEHLTKVHIPTPRAKCLKSD